MRHLGSIVLALILGTAIWVLTGVGVSKFAEARAGHAAFGIDLAIGLTAVVVAGICYAVLILPRLSPLGPVVAGLAFLGLVGWRVGDLSGFNRMVPADVFHVEFALHSPAEGYAALLALPLLATLFSARRWRRHEYPPALYAASMPAAYSDPDYPTPTYPVPAYPSPAYPAVGANEPTWPFSTDDTDTTRRL